jgi:hypothetical protein
MVADVSKEVGGQFPGFLPAMAHESEYSGFVLRGRRKRLRVGTIERYETPRDLASISTLEHLFHVLDVGMELLRAQRNLVGRSAESGCGWVYNVNAG